MARLSKDLKAILDKYGIDPTDKSKLWDCHGTLVLYHKAYEIIAAKEDIRFDQPHVIESNSEKKIACIVVTGHMGERYEWSFGEASPSNCTNKYPYAMAEKRAKDRVIAKLVGLAAHVYSEDEAEEFKNAKGNIGIEFSADDVADPIAWFDERSKNLQAFVVDSKNPTQENFEKRVQKIINDPIYSKLDIGQVSQFQTLTEKLQKHLEKRLQERKQND